jgi:hemoglobin
MIRSFRSSRHAVLAAVLALAALAAPLAVTTEVHAQGAASSATDKPSLYKRLGGYDAIAAVTDDFIGRMATDPTVGHFFAGHSTARLQAIRQMVVDMICMATGGPCFYIGHDMKTAHAGLRIGTNDWDVSVNHLVATLDKFHVPAAEKAELLAIVGSLKEQVVEVK